jgi:hypothetical protein
MKWDKVDEGLVAEGDIYITSFALASLRAASLNLFKEAVMVDI